MNSAEIATKEQFEKFKLKYQNKQNTRSFLLGFLFGIGLSIRVRYGVASERPWSRPWATLATGLFFGSAIHWWNWKKRVILEEICEREDDFEIKNLELKLQYTKAGDDMEHPTVSEYLKKEKLI